MPFARRGGVRSRRTAHRITTIRKVTAALLAGASVLLLIRMLAPPAPVGRVDAVVAARDLAAGAVLRSEDLVVVARDPAELPSRLVTDPADVVGRSVAGPVASGEVLTTVRLPGPALLAGQPPGFVAVGVPLGDAALIDAVHPGEQVSVHAAGTGAQVARGTVLAVRVPESSAITTPAGSASVILAVREGDVPAIAAGLAGPGAGFVLALHE